MKGRWCSPLPLVLALLTTSAAQPTLLQFASQQEAALDRPTNLATLATAVAPSSSSQAFTICASIYVGFFRGHQAFYTMRRDGVEDLWFSLFLIQEDQPDFNYLGGSEIPADVSGLGLRSHAWSHACTAVHGATGRVTVVMNSVPTHDFNHDGFRVDVLPRFEGNVILGASQWQSSLNSSGGQQSEASVSNVNIFSRALAVPEMVNLTSGTNCTEGDLLAWSAAAWDTTGQVASLPTEGLCRDTSLGHLYLLPFLGRSWSACIRLCPRLRRGGRVPGVESEPQSRHLIEELKLLDPDFSAGPDHWIWAPFSYISDGRFMDAYTEEAMAAGLWVGGQPNGGGGQRCSGWWRGEPMEAGVYDTPCSNPSPGRCVCQFHEAPRLRLRGLCSATNVDSDYVFKYSNGSVVYKGRTGSEIRFTTTLGQAGWSLDMKMARTSGYTTPGASHTTPRSAREGRAG